MADRKQERTNGKDRAQSKVGRKTGRKTKGRLENTKSSKVFNENLTRKSAIEWRIEDEIEVFIWFV